MISTFGDVFEVDPKIKIAKNSDVPFVEMADIEPWARTVGSKGTKKFAAGSKFLDGDVLVARITPSLENGKTSIYRASRSEKSAPAAGSTEFIVVRGIEGKSLSEFAYYLLRTTDLRSHLIANMNGSSGRQRVQSDALRNYVVDLPSLEEQRRIAGVLGALDDKIESNLRTISLSESLILAHFSQLFNSGHVSAGTALSDLMEVNPRYSLKRESLAIKVSMQDIPSDSPVINTHSVMPVGAGSRFSNGDVLFARISPCLENGKTAVVDFLSGSEVGFGSTEFIILSPRGEISTTWIYALAREPNFREACRQAMSGSSGRQRLSADFFSRYTIATPKEFDLVAFNKATMPLLTLMGARRDENQRLAQLRDALLPELMSGRMRVDKAGCLVSEALDEEVADV
ncbi:restriction endonuclease subunit S [uncultured Actinomyces sp.]|uniref:restriction endonuclease subunit S n=1 Tax=uncultured Actinomyces sp. TaxID=249061 RepID=UPI00262D2B00|nr:restriction endonuclease subunit S [uncultured Actinomyces sp.]